MLLRFGLPICFVLTARSNEVSNNGTLLVQVKEKKGVLVWFKEVFRYGFDRFDLEDRLFNFIPRGET